MVGPWKVPSAPGALLLSAVVLLSSWGVAGALVGSPATTGPYFLEFVEAGLPLGASWSLWIEGVTFYSTTTTIGLYEPAGVHAIQLSSGNGMPLARITGPHAPGPAWINTTGPSVFHVLFGANESLTFNVTGIPFLDPWSVTLTPVPGHAGPSPQIWSSSSTTSIGPKCGATDVSRCLGVVYDPVTGEAFVAASLTDLPTAGATPGGYVLVFNETTGSPSGELVAEVPINGTPEAMVYDPTEGSVYVASAGLFTWGALTVISDRSDRAVATIPLGGSPFDIAYDPAQDEVFVENGSSALTPLPWYLTVVNASTNTVSRVVAPPSGSAPEGLAFDPDLDQLFLATGSNVSRLYGTNGTFGTPIAAPGAWAVEPIPGARLEILDGDCSGTAGVEIVDAANGTVLRTVPLPGFCPQALAFDPNLNTTFVGGFNTSVVVLLNATTYGTESVDIGAICPRPGLLRGQMVFDPATQQLLLGECDHLLRMNDTAPLWVSSPTFTVPAGAVYRFHVSVGNPSYRPIPAKGRVVVPSHDLVRAVKLRQLSSAAVFRAYNLTGVGVQWSVTITGGPFGDLISYPFTKSGYVGSGAIRFLLPNGTYTYTVGSTAETPLTASGNFTVTFPSRPQVFVIPFS